MLIPSYATDIRSGKSMCSSHCSQAYRTHRPAIKGKHRNLVPTISSLLTGTFARNPLIETSNDELEDIHLMEVPIKAHEILERSNGDDTLKPLHSDYKSNKNYPKVSYTCLKSHRTEDISIRENEDGVRTHFCPLDESRDSPTKNEGEEFFAEPSKVDIDAELYLKNFSLKSEDIISLEAEKPPLSESDDENDISDVDSSTYMIYASDQNRQFVNADNSLKSLLDHQMTSLSSKKISKSTLSSWTEDSSEEEESSLIPSVTDSNTEMQLQQKYTELIESDMEEFERRAEPKANGFKELKLKKETNKNLLYDEESHCNKIIEKADNDEKFNVANFSVTKDEENNAKENSSVLKPTFENSIQKRYVSKENSDSKCCPREFDDKKQIDDLLKAVVELASLNAAVKLQKFDDKIYLNSVSDLNKEKSQLKSERIAAERHLLKDSNTEVKKTDDVLAESNIIWGKEREYKKPEENAPDCKVYINTENPAPDVSVRFKVSKGLGAERKEDEKGNFSMEPISLHSKPLAKNEETQPDLATALRFMTEVYPNRNDDELYLDTLSTSSDHSSEKSVKESSRASTLSKKYRDIQEKPPVSNPEEDASTTESGPFEPVIVENQRAVKRPRNKFSKFFQSFKRRLAKKP